jgi:hypothetical protein
MMRLGERALRRFARNGIPTGPPVHPRRRVRLFALLAFRNEAEYLPGYLRNVAPHVDGIVALDDGSTDGSAELLEGRPEVLELLRVPPGRPAWDEPANYRALVEAAQRHGPGWAISLDADERVERRFRARAERAIARGRRLGLTAYAVRLRELWGSPDTWRADGVWALKGPPRMFELRPDHRFDERALHAGKVPLQARRVRGGVPRADVIVYHLRMVREEDRRARRERYERLDPTAEFQPREGYAYLTDDTGIELRRVGRRRGYDG